MEKDFSNRYQQKTSQFLQATLKMCENEKLILAKVCNKNETQTAQLRAKNTKTVKMYRSSFKILCNRQTPVLCP